MAATAEGVVDSAAATAEEAMEVVMAATVVVMGAVEREVVTAVREARAAEVRVVVGWGAVRGATEVLEVVTVAGVMEAARVVARAAAAKAAALVVARVAVGV